MMTLKETVAAALSRRMLQTASELLALDAIRSRCSLATLSSTLNQLVKSGVALRLKGFGPRGGYGYVHK
jgi:hypothetical protein